MNHFGHEDWEVTLPVRYPHHYEYTYFVCRDTGEQWEGGPNLSAASRSRPTIPSFATTTSGSTDPRGRGRAPSGSVSYRST